MLTLKYVNKERIVKLKLVGADIKNLRKNLGLSQVEFASKVGVTVQTVGNWERKSDKKIPTKYFKKISEFSETEANEDNERIVRTGFFRKAKDNIRGLHFLENAIALYYVALDKNVSIVAKSIALGALAYFINPVDVIPDFIPFSGFIDDAAIIATAISILASSITETHKSMAREKLQKIMGTTE